MTKSATREAADGELFKSTGIDDNATSTAVTIDASENVGINNSSPTKKLHITSVDNAATTDIALFESNNATVGIGVGFNTIRQTGANRIGFEVNSVEKARIDTDGLKFNGDTAAANALDDYEEGTFTAVVTMGSGTATVNSSQNTLYYTKVGNLCTVGGQFQLSAVSNPSGSFLLTLPFHAGTGRSLSAGTYRTYSVDTPNDGTSNIMYSDNNTAVFQWSRDSASSTNENATSGGYYMIGLTYFTT